MGEMGGGVGYHDFPSKVFCPTVPKNFVEEPFSVPLFLGIDNFYDSEGYITVFCQKLFVPQCQKVS